MTNELQLRPEEQPQVEDAWQWARDLHDVLSARIELFRPLKYTIRVTPDLYKIPVIPMNLVPFTVETRRRSHKELTAMLTHYEDQYGFSTAELTDKLQSGELDETLDIRRWLSLRAIQQRLTR